MHPSDNANTFFIVIGSFEYSFHFFRRVGSTFVYHLDRKFPGFIQSVYHFIRVCVYCDYCVTQILIMIPKV